MSFVRKSGSTTCLSCVEVVVLLLLSQQISFPAFNSERGQWQDAALFSFPPEQLTFAVEVRLVRKVVRLLYSTCGLDDLYCDDISLGRLGVHFPLVGVRVGFCSEQLQAAKGCSGLFCCLSPPAGVGRFRQAVPGLDLGMDLRSLHRIAVHERPTVCAMTAMKSPIKDACP